VKTYYDTNLSNYELDQEERLLVPEEVFFAYAIPKMASKGGRMQILGVEIIKDFKQEDLRYML